MDSHYDFEGAGEFKIRPTNWLFNRQVDATATALDRLSKDRSNQDRNHLMNLDDVR